MVLHGNNNMVISIGYRGQFTKKEECTIQQNRSEENRRK